MVASKAEVTAGDSWNGALVDGRVTATATGSMSNTDWLHPHNKNFEFCPLLYLALPPSAQQKHKQNENTSIQNEDAQHRGQRYKVHKQQPRVSTLCVDTVVVGVSSGIVHNTWWPVLVNWLMLCLWH